MADYVDAEYVETGGGEGASPETTALVSTSNRVEGGMIPQMVEMAHRYPRVLSTSIREAESMALLNPEIAGSCFFSLKRKDKNSPDGFKIIQGPSIRLAEIMLSAWGNITVKTWTDPVGPNDVVVRAHGQCIDTQKAIGSESEVVRSIAGKYGRFTPDVISLTVMAAQAVARRNAIMGVVPRAYVDDICEKAKQVATGGAKGFAVRRDEIFGKFLKNWNVTAATILASLGRKAMEDVTGEDLAHLIGLGTSIKDGELSIEAAFAVPEDDKPTPTLTPGTHATRKPPASAPPKANGAPPAASAPVDVLFTASEPTAPASEGAKADAALEEEAADRAAIAALWDYAGQVYEGKKDAVVACVNGWLEPATPLASQEDMIDRYFNLSPANRKKLAAKVKKTLATVNPPAAPAAQPTTEELPL